MIGSFSKLACEYCGSVIYLDEDGNEVEVTGAHQDKADFDSYGWKDKKIVSTKLVKYLREERKGTVESELKWQR